MGGRGGLAAQFVEHVKARQPGARVGSDLASQSCLLTNMNLRNEHFILALTSTTTVEMSYLCFSLITKKADFRALHDIGKSSA